MGIDTYLNRIASQHSSQPKYMAWLSAPLNIVQDNINAANSIISSFDIDNAIGTQLDVLGTIVGCDRQVRFQPSDGSSPILDDYTYRLLMKAKIAVNQWDGTIEGIYNIWNNTFTDLDLFVVDNQDMSMKAIVTGTSSILIQNLIQNNYIVPKPQGVTVTYEFDDITFMNGYVGIVAQEGSFETVKQTS